MCLLGGIFITTGILEIFVTFQQIWPILWSMTNPPAVKALTAR